MGLEIKNLYAGQEETVRTEHKNKGKEYVKSVSCHLAYLIYMQSISSKMSDWMKHKLILRLLGELSMTSEMQMIPLLWKKVKRN